MSDFRVQGEVSLDGSKFLGGMKQMELAANRTGSNIVNSLGGRLAGLFAVGSVAAFGKSIVDMGGKLRDMADQTGTNVEWFQKMANSVELAGGSAEDLAKMILEINKAREAAFQNPTGKEAQIFSQRGISASQVQNLNTQEFVSTFVKGFEGKMNSQAANDLQVIGGKTSKNLLAAIATGIDMESQSMSGKTISALDEIGDRFAVLSKQLKITVAPAIVFLMEQLQKLADFATDIGKGVQGKKKAIEEGGDYGAKAALYDFNAKVYHSASVAADIALGERGGIAEKLMQLSVGQEYGMKATAPKTAALVDASDDAIKRERLATDAKRKAIAAELESLRAQRETSAPGFVKKNEAPKTVAARKIESDSLLAVGNFLGASRSGLANYAAQQVDQQKITNQKLGEISNKLGKGDDLGLP